MNLSKKTRKSIYKRAIKHISVGCGYSFLCGQLYMLYDPLNIYTGLNQPNLLDLFPEFAMFKPEDRDHMEEWFDIKDCSKKDLSKMSAICITEYMQMERLICLELCLLMLEDA